MKRLIVTLLINAVALWLTTLLVTGVHVVPFEPGSTLEVVLTYLLVALIFGVVNGVIGTTIRVLAFPLYVLTLGLVAFIVNGFLLLIVHWISDAIGFGLVVDGFWWGVLAAFVLGLISWVLGIFLKPVTREPRKR